MWPGIPQYQPHTKAYRSQISVVFGTPNHVTTKNLSDMPCQVTKNVTIVTTNEINNQLLLINRKAFTQGHTNHFAAVVTYLQFQIQVHFSATLPELGFLPISLSLQAENATFSSCKPEHWHMTLIYEPHLDMVEVNDRAKYICQRSFPWKYTYTYECGHIKPTALCGPQSDQ